MTPGAAPVPKLASGTSLGSANLAIDSKVLPDVNLTYNEVFQDNPNIRELIPNINTQGLTFAGKKSSVLRHVGLNSQTRFADILCQRVSFCIEDWPSMIKDQVVVDLCAGNRPYGYYLACIGEARAYIGVEAYVADALLNALSCREELISDLLKFAKESAAETGRVVRLIPKLVVAEDAATFIERITDNSVSIFTFGMQSLLEDEQLYRLDRAIPVALSKIGCMVAYPESVCCGSKLSVRYQKPIYVARQRT